MQKKIILILLFALVVAVFAIQNSNPVTIKLFQWEDRVSLAFIIIGSIVFGSIVMAVVTSFTQLKMGKKIRSLKRKNEQQEEEINDLKIEINKIREDNNELSPDKGMGIDAQSNNNIEDEEKGLDKLT